MSSVSKGNDVEEWPLLPMSVLYHTVLSLSSILLVINEHGLFIPSGDP